MISDRFRKHALRAALAAGLVLAALPAAAQSLVVRQLDGATFDLAAHRGEVVLVNFWATWCEPCRAEIPALSNFYRRHRRAGLAMIGVSADIGRDAGKVKAMAGAMSYPVALLRDASANSFGAPRGLPVTYVFDRRGALRATLRPDEIPVAPQSLERMVAPLLKEK